MSAIAFAYEAIGQKEEAAVLLRESISAASKVEKGEIFLFPDYRYVEKKKFLSAIERRLKGLDDSTAKPGGAD